MDKNIFQQIPPDKKVEQFVCKRCGSIIFSQKQHLKWHYTIENKIKKLSERLKTIDNDFWPGVNDNY